jgi:hypothetical protein
MVHASIGQLLLKAERHRQLVRVSVHKLHQRTLVTLLSSAGQTSAGCGGYQRGSLQRQVGSIERVSTGFVKLRSPVVKRAPGQAQACANTEHRYLTPRRAQ